MDTEDTAVALVRTSLEMVDELPARIADAGDETERRALLDSFYVNLRLLGDFFTRRSDRDIHAGLFNMPIPATPEAKRLGGRWWAEASQHVVHLSNRRLEAKPVRDLPQHLAEARDDATAVCIGFYDYLIGYRTAPWVERTYLRGRLIEMGVITPS